jgi:outer membrane lipoprotein-sorting protein
VPVLPSGRRRNRESVPARLHPTACKGVSSVLSLLVRLLLFAPTLAASLSLPTHEDVASIMRKMETAYGRVNDYQTETEVRVYRDARIVETKRFRYTFRKPNHIRLDFEAPHPGMILVYPDEDGKVVVKPGGWAGFLRFHLAPDSSLLKASSGQRIEQTDMGLLIQNISHSVTDRRRGEVRLSEEDGRVVIEVLAEDHFLAGISTLYRFYVDEKLWLPVEVQEFTPEGVLKREVFFRGLRTSIGISDAFFRIKGGNGKDDRSG